MFTPPNPVPSNITFRPAYIPAVLVQVKVSVVAEDVETMGWLTKGTVDAKRLYWKNMPSGTTPRLPAGVIQFGVDMC